MSELLPTSNPFSNELLNLAASMGCYTPQLEKKSIPVDDDLSQRVQARISQREKNRQKNIDDILHAAYSNLEARTNLPTQASCLDIDWFNRLILNAQDVSNEEMKMMWSKILAGEIVHPKSFSLRTLGVLRDMTKDDARLISSIAPYVLHDNDGNTFIFREEEMELTIPYSDILYLMELRILDSSTEMVIYEQFDSVVEDYSNICRYRTQNVGIVIGSNSNIFSFPAYGFTSVGKQILSLIDNVTPNVEFFKKQLKKITHDEKCRCGYISDSDEHPFKIGKIIFEL